MRTGVRAGVFVAVLVGLFAAAFGAGRLLNDDSARAAEHPHQQAYRLVLEDPTATASGGALRFTVRDAHGDVLTDFALKHERRLHLIAVDTGYSGFQHLHPTMAADGTWSTPIALAPGVTSLYADFRPVDGEDAVARSSIERPGPVGSPAFSLLRSQDVDGYRVTALGDLSSGRRSTISFEVGRNGVGVTDLQPYLGAYGHLVILRESDGAYQHVHPEDGPPGPQVSFAAEVPSPGRYHLYFDFRHNGVVRNAHVVLDAAAGQDGPHEQEGMEHGDH